MHNLDFLVHLIFIGCCIAGFIVGSYMGCFFILNSKRLIERLRK